MWGVRNWLGVTDNWSPIAEELVRLLDGKPEVFDLKYTAIVKNVNKALLSGTTSSIWLESQDK